MSEKLAVLPYKIGNLANFRIVRAARGGVAILTDTNITRSHAGALTRMFGEAPVLAIEPGENAKSLK